MFDVNINYPSKETVCNTFQTDIHTGQDADSQTDTLDLSNLIALKQANLNNPFISYLNLNSLRCKIIDIREVLCKAQLEIIALSETKLNSEFPDAQFKIEGYRFPPFRKDRDEYGGGLMIFVRNYIITRRLHDFEPKDLKCICIELTLSKKKWVIFSVYRPQSENVSGFFDKLANSIDRAISTYDNVVIMGDININTQDHQSQCINRLFQFCDIFGLQNLIKSITCETKTSFYLDRCHSNQSSKKLQA